MSRTTIRPFEIGVCSWSLQVTGIKQLEGFLGELGVVATQLALGDPNHATWEEGDGLVDAARSASFDITGTMIGFPGEDYTSPETIRRTGGFGDPASRAERLKIFNWAVDKTSELGVKVLTTHAGFIPEPGDADRGGFLDTLSEAVDYATSKGVTLTLETGQETADLLRRTLDEMEAPNLKINFDPANMILYNKGDPIDALEVLGPDVVHVHVKDAKYPERDGEWGEEVPLGEGAVGMRDFLEGLVEIGYTGPLVVEREVGDQQQRFNDILGGVRLLKGLVSDLQISGF